MLCSATPPACRLFPQRRPSHPHVTAGRTSTGGIKRTLRDCPTSPRWPTGAVCTRGSALHNVSRAHSRWVLRSRWKGSRGLPVQAEVPSGHLRQRDYASPTLPRAEASCSRKAGPKIGSRFTDSRWGGRGEREEQNIFWLYKSAL